MRWATVPFLLGVAACGFSGSGGGDSPDGGPPDGPPLMPGETDIIVDSVAKWNEGAAMDGTFVSTAAGASGTVEPVARLGGKLFLEIDDVGGPYNGTWATHPTPDQLVRTSFQEVSFSREVPGGTPTFVYWFSGEVRLENGAQKISVVASPGAGAFVDVLQRDGKTEIVHCAANATCDIATNAEGWYPIRMGWKRAAGNGATFDLKYAVGNGNVENIDVARLRAPLVTAQHTGSRLEGFDIQRCFDALNTAIIIDATKPVDLDWGMQIFGLNQNASYRNVAQLRIAETGSYDFVVDANGGSSHRFWLDGEWVTLPALWDYIDDDNDPAPTVITRQLTAGWHDLVLEGYDTRGNNGNVELTYGKTGGARVAPALSATRPAVGVAPQFATQINDTAIALASNAPVSRTLTINNLATAAPTAAGIDVAITLKPRMWNNLQIKVIPPDGAAISLAYDNSQLTNNQMTKVTGSLSKAALGNNAKAQGDWKVEVTHPNDPMLDGTNTISEVEVHVFYAGAQDVNGAKLVDASSKYSRMFKLDQERELRNILVDALKPAGSDVRIEIAKCSDEAGTSCQTAMSIEQLVANKPMAQYVKVTTTFMSNGYVVPSISKLTLRYLGDAK